MQLSGLQALNSAAGLKPAQGAAPASGLTTQGMPGLDIVTNQLPDSWLSPDLKSGTIDWGMFNPINLNNYEAILNTSYKPKPVAPKKPISLNGGIASVLQQTSAFRNNSAPVVEKQGYFNEKPEPKKSTPYSPLGFLHNSEGSQGGLQDAMYNIEKRRYDDAMSKMAYVPSDAVTFRDQRINDAIKALDINTQYLSTRNFTDADRAERDKRLGDVSTKFSMTTDDLKRYLGQYESAVRTLTDPVGANWQDLKNTGDFYKKVVLPGVRRYSGYDDTFFNNLNSQASEGTRNSQKYLDAEYYALHGVTPNVQRMPGVKQGDLIGVTNPKLTAWWSDRYNNNPGTSMSRKRVGLGYSLPYNMSDWQDYLDTNVSRMDATPEQKAAAEARYAKYKDYLSKKVADGGQFNIWRELGSEVDPYKVTKTKGGKWKPRNSGYTNQLNIAQNFLPQATEGKKTFEDAGYNVDDAYKSGFYFEKKKKKGLFGGGLGALLSLASFIPGPVGIGARIASAVSAASQGNIAGALMGGLGAYGQISGTNLLGDLTSKVSSALNVSPSVANALVQGGVGGIGAKLSGGDFTKGALGGGLGAYATGELGNLLASSGGLSPELAGALSGGAGSVLSGTIQGAKGVPLALGAAQGALSGYSRGRNISKRQRQGTRRA